MSYGIPLDQAIEFLSDAYMHSNFGVTKDEAIKYVKELLETK